MDRRGVNKTKHSNHALITAAGESPAAACNCLDNYYLSVLIAVDSKSEYTFRLPLLTVRVLGE